MWICIILLIEKDELEGIANQEICDTWLDDLVELVYLTNTRQYVAWRLKFHQYGRHRYNLEVVPYSYVIRDKVPPPKFNTLIKELILFASSDGGVDWFASSGYG